MNFHFIRRNLCKIRGFSRKLFYVMFVQMLVLFKVFTKALIVIKRPKVTMADITFYNGNNSEFSLK